MLSWEKVAQRMRFSIDDHIVTQTVRGWPIPVQDSRMGSMTWHSQPQEPNETRLTSQATLQVATLQSATPDESSVMILHCWSSFLTWLFVGHLSYNLKIWSKGKTSLCVRYAHNTFEPSHLSTIQAALITKKLRVRSGEKVMVDFCDTAGQKRFHSLGSIYYKKADAAIVVFDRTDSKSLQEGFLIP